MSEVDLQDFINRNFLKPLDEYLRKDGKWQEAINSPFARQYMRDGHVYAMPASAQPQAYALFYRKDRFRRAGLDPEKPPTTWKEFLDCAAALTDPRTPFPVS